MSIASHRTLLLVLTLLLVAGGAVSACSPGGGGGSDSLDVRLGPGEVRAGQIARQSELLTGPEAHGWLGDFKLYNDRVAFVISGAEDVRGWSNTGGTVLDADRIRAQGAPGQEVFQEIMPTIDLLTVRPRTIAVTADGRDGGPAIVSVDGAHHGFIIIDGLLPGTLAPKDIRITQEYILEPDADYLRIRTRVRSGASYAQAVTVGDLVLNGDLADDFVPGPGLLAGASFSGDLPWYGGIHPDSCTLYAAAEGDIATGLSLEGITPLDVIRGQAPAAGSADPDLIAERVLIVGDGPLDDCLAILRDLRGGAATGTLSGTILSGQQPLAGAVVLALDESLETGRNAVDQAYSDAAGAWSMALPPGDYRVQILAAGHAPWTSEPAPLTAGAQAGIPTALPAPGVLIYSCTDASSALPAPCKITVQDGLAADRATATRTDLLTFGLTGQGRVPLTPGDYTITFSRGWEYAIHQQSVSLASGQEVPVAASLAHQVDTTGYLALDSHSHSGRSPETHFPIADKLAANICEGVEIMVAADHDCTNDFSGQLADLSAVTGVDLTQYIRPVAGVEVSPIGKHFTTFPLPVHPTGWIHWQLPYVLYGDDDRVERLVQFPELFENARALGAAVVNVAHPIGDKGYFSQLGFAPPDTLPRLSDLDPEKYSPDFDTIEVINSGATGRMLDGNLPLWMALNNQGLFRTATGVSDAHTRHDTPGHGRTFVQSSTDAPDEVDLEEIWTKLKAGRAVVSDGILVYIDLDGQGPGSLVSQAAPVSLRVRVEAADWIAVDEIVVFGNGQEVARLMPAATGELDPARPALRFDELVDLSPAVDTWYAVLALGPENPGLRPIIAGRPSGVTNAIRVDVDGDGVFTPPRAP